MVGAMGNLGGIIFAIIFRYNGSHYARSIWIIGIISIAVNLAVCWIRPIPKGQIGGRSAFKICSIMKNDNSERRDGI